MVALDTRPPPMTPRGFSASPPRRGAVPWNKAIFLLVLMMFSLLNCCFANASIQYSFSQTEYEVETSSSFNSLSATLPITVRETGDGINNCEFATRSITAQPSVDEDTLNGTTDRHMYAHSLRTASSTLASTEDAAFLRTTSGLTYLAQLSSSTLDLLLFNGRSFERVHTVPVTAAKAVIGFNMGSDAYFAVSTLQGPSPSRFITSSPIFRLQDNRLVAFQNISTFGASQATFFSINGAFYLCHANYEDNAHITRVPSIIYRFNTTTNAFVQFQNISTVGASGVLAQRVDNNTFLLLFANNYDSSTARYEVNSQVFLWNSTSSRFNLIQNIATVGAASWAYTNVNDRHLFAVANTRTTAGSFATNSIVYRWNATSRRLDTFQSIPTTAISRWTAVTVAGSSCLFSSNIGVVAQGFSATSILYCADPTTAIFSRTLSFPTVNAKSASSLDLSNTTTLLALAANPSNILKLGFAANFADYIETSGVLTPLTNLPNPNATRTHTILVGILLPTDMRRPGNRSFALDLFSNGGQLVASANIVIFNKYITLFTNQSFFLTLVENSPALSLAAPTLTWDTTARNISFTLISGSDFFTLNPTTAELRSLRPFSWLVQSLYALQVKATRSDDSFDLANVFVSILDTNDNIPQFSTTNYYGVFNESQPSRTVILRVSASDLDSGINGTVTYSFVTASSDNAAKDFLIDPVTGVISTARVFSSRNDTATYSLTVRATDGGPNGGLFSEVGVSIVLQDLNLNAPLFSQSLYILNVSETTPIGSALFTLLATDADLPGSRNSIVFFSLLQGTATIFSVSISGTITLTSNLDFITQNTYNFTVVASDGGLPVRSSTARVIVNVLYAIIAPPTFSQPSYSAVFNDQLNAASRVLVVSAQPQTALYLRRSVRYALSSPSEFVSINETSGEIVTIKTVYADGTPLLSFVVRAFLVGRSNLFNEVTVNVIMVSVNVVPPTITSDPSFSIAENLPADSVVGVVQVENLNGYGVPSPVVWSFSTSSSVFEINQTTGVITTLVSLDYEATRFYSLFVTATDLVLATKSVKQLINIDVENINDNYPRFLQTSYNYTLTENYVGSLFAVQATDFDTTDFIYSLEAGPYSANFAIDSNTGLLSVVAPIDHETTPSTFTLSVLVNDTGFATSLQGQSFVYFTLIDLNDNPPVITGPTTVMLRENTAVGSTVAAFQVTDLDATQVNRNFTFSLLSGNTDHLFTLVGQSLLLTTAPSAISSYTIVLYAENTAYPSLSSTHTVSIILEAVNRFSPMFSASAYMGNVSEDAPLGFAVVTISAFDNDIYPANANITFSMEGDALALACFQMQVTQLAKLNLASFVLNCSLDYETKDFYFFQVVASDNGAPARSTRVNISVYVDNVIHIVPQFSKTVYTIQLNESWPVDKPFLTTYAGISHVEPNFSVEYFLACNCPLFSLNSTTGQLSLRDSLQYDVAASHALFILAINTRADPPATAIATVLIRVLQINTLAPGFSRTNFSSSILEDTAVNTLVTTITASDRDRPLHPNAITYRITSGNTASAFSLDQNSGELRVARALNFSRLSLYQLGISACDQATSPLCNFTTVIIQLLRVNQQAPQFVDTPYMFSILEHLPAGTLVNGTILAVDPDPFPGDRVVYSLRFPVPEFSLNATTGEIKTTIMLDYTLATQRTFQLLVVANDTAAYKPKTSQTLVTIELLNVIEPPPVFLPTNVYDVSLPENLANNTFVTSVRATTIDPFDTLLYRIEDLDASNTLKFHIDSEGVVTCDSLDYEAVTFYSLLVVVTSYLHGDQVSHALNVSVQDLNDNAPVFVFTDPQVQQYEFAVFENITNETSFGGVLATDADSPPNAQFLFSLVSGARQTGFPTNQFFIDPVSGALSARDLDYEDQNQYTLVVRAQETAAPYHHTDVNVIVTVLDVVDPAPIFVPVGVVAVYENFTVGEILVQLQAIDTQPSIRSRLEFSLDCCHSHFAINSSTGVITTIVALDREVVDFFNLTVSVADVGDSSLTASITVPVQVLDLSDSIPIFSQPKYTVNISEDTANILLVHVQASSRDTPVFGTIDGYFFLDTFGSLVSSNEWLTIDASGNVLLVAPLNFEQQNFHTFAIVAVDRGGLMGSVLLEINVAEVIYPPPIFADASPTFIVVNELLPVGSLVHQFQGATTDPDRTLTYVMDQGDTSMFALNATHGQLTLIGKLNFDTTSVYPLAVSVHDNPRFERKSDLLAYVFVLDSYSDLPLFDLVTLDPVKETAPVGTVVGRVQATHRKGSNYSTISYFLVSGDSLGAFAVNASTGVITVAGPLNWKLRKEYRLEITAVESSVKHRFSTTNITIDIIDMNTNPPVLDRSLTSISISEKLPMNSSLFLFSYTDIDNGFNALATFALLDGNDRGCFDLDEVTGQLYLSCALNYDTQQLFQLKIRVRNVAEPFFEDTMLFDIHVFDVYIAPPIFTLPIYSASISEATLPNTNLLTVQLTGADGDGVVPGFEPHFALANTFNNMFSVDPSSGSLSLTGSLNWSMASSYNVVVIGTNALNPSEQTQVSAFIQVIDTNNNNPFFVLPPATVSLPENTIPGLLLTLSAMDVDSPDNTHLEFALVSNSPLFDVDAGTGDVFLMSTLDYETNSGPHSAVFSVCDNDYHPVSLCGYTSISFEITDVNDNPPVFSMLSYTLAVSEATALGSTLVSLAATDADTLINGMVQYTLDGSSLPFVIDAQGSLLLAEPLDFENITVYNFHVNATDGLYNVMATVTVHVTDVNDNLPRITSENVFYVSEKLDLGMPVGVIEAADADAGALLEYTIDPNTGFAINSVTGLLTLARRLDSAVEVIAFNVYVSDRSAEEHAVDGTAPMAGLVTIHVRNDSSAPVFTQAIYRVNISEYTIPQLSSSLLTVSAQDSDNPSYPIAYSLIESSPFFDLQSNGVLRLTSSIALIRVSKITLLVEAVNPWYPRLRQRATLIINIIHLNNYAPKFGSSYYTATVRGLLGQGEFIVNVSATDRDFGQAGKVTYAISADNSQDHNIALELSASGYEPGTIPFTIDNQGRVFTTSPIGSLYGPAMYSITIVATDEGTPSRSTTVVLYVFIQHDLSIDTPVFPAPFAVVHMSELTVANTLVYKASASTSNPASQPFVGYFVAGASVPNSFTANLTGGEVYNNQNFNLTQYAEFFVVLAAFNSRRPELYSLLTLHVVVDNVNFNAPQFRPSSPTVAFVPESLGINEAVTTIEAYDMDTDRNGQISYSLTSTDSAFSIDRNTGVIRVAKRLRSDSHPEGYLCFVAVQDHASYTLFNFAIITVYVLNSQPGPQFSQSFYSTSVAESASIGTYLVTVQATDFFNDTRNITYYASTCSVPIACPLSVEPITGTVSVSQTLDREAYSTVTLQVRAYDDENNFNTVAVVVDVLDVNDNTPVFAANLFSVDVMAGSGHQTLGVFTATDVDLFANAQLTYTLDSVSPSLYESHFSISPQFGLLTLDLPVNFQQIRFINLTLRVTDGGSPALSSTTTVAVTVIDNKDNKPVFDSALFIGQLAENEPLGTSAVQVSAKVLDHLNTLLNIPIFFSLVGTLDFAIDSQTGVVTSNAVFDRESIAQYDFFVQAVDGTGFTAMASVRVVITDQNDNLPIFASTLIPTLSLSENSVDAVILTTVSATDLDAGNNGRVSYSIVPSAMSMNFAIDANSGVLTAVAPLDAEQARSFSLVVAASDNGINPQTTTFTFIINVNDVNDNAPQLFLPNHHFVIDESLPVNSTLLTASFSDADVGDNAMAHFVLVSGNEAGFFTLNAQSGVLSVATILDYSVQTVFRLRLRVVNDMVSPTLFTEDWVDINMTDMYKSLPQFLNTFYNASLLENSSPSFLVTVSAVDVDPIPPRYPYRIEYMILEKISNPNLPFSINSRTGDLHSTRALDRELVANYMLTVQATLFGYLTQTTSTSVIITVLDTNDNNPLILAADTVLIDELLPIGTIVYTAQASDADIDANGAVSFSLEDGLPYFSINSVTGVVNLTNVLSYSAFESHQTTLTIVCKDHGTPQRSNTSLITVVIRDVNDNAPIFTSASTLSVLEDTTLGSVLMNVTTVDADVTINAYVELSITGGNVGEKFVLDPVTGILTLQGSLDREQRDSYELVIEASNPQAATPQTTYQVLRISVLDVNDNVPLFDPYPSTLQFNENTTVGTAIASVHATDADLEANSLIRYSLSVSGGSFVIDPITGVVSVDGVLDAERQLSYNLNITASDSGSPMLSTTILINITLNPLNNRFPVFTGDLVTRINLTESFSVFSLVYTAFARGYNLAPVASYAIVSGDLGYFSINSLSGQVTLVQPLNWSVYSTYSLVISATNTGGLVSHMTLVVTVLDTNNNRPIFNSASYTASIAENQVGSRPLVRVVALDPDQGLAGTAGLRFSIDAGTSSEKFAIDSKTGWILAIAPFDFEVERNRPVVIRARATDSGVPQQTRVVFVFITVLDVYDDLPYFAPRVYTTTVNELVSIGTPLASVTAFDWNKGLYGPIVYSLMVPLPAITINSVSGVVSTSNVLAEQLLHKNFIIYVQASNSRGVDVAIVNVTVTETLPNVPYFAPSHYAPVIAEDTAVGTVIDHIKAFDQNLGDNGQVYYMITGATDMGAFQLDYRTGELKVASILDRESQPWHMLQVVATFEPPNQLFRRQALSLFDDAHEMALSENVPVVVMNRRSACSSCASALTADDCGSSCVWEAQFGYCREAACSDVILRSGCVARSECSFDDNAALCHDNTTPLPCEAYSLESICPTDRCNWQQSMGMCTPISVLPSCSYYAQSNCPLGCAIATTGLCASFKSCQQFNSTSCRYGCFLDLTNQCQDMPANAECYPSLTARAVTSTTTTTTTTTSTTTPPPTTVTTTTTTTTSTTTTVPATTPTTMEMTSTRSTTVAHTTPTNPPDFISPTCSQCTWTYINVTLTDVNDNIPTLSCPSFVAYPESTEVGTALFSCSASDPDLLDNGFVTFRFGTNIPEFEIDRITGEVRLASGLDLLRTRKYTLVVIAEDHGVPSLSINTTVHVEVGDVNNHKPTFSQAVYTWQVVENSPIGTIVGQVLASDLDENANGQFTFAIINGSSQATSMLSIDAVSGEVILLDSPDREDIDSYTLVVRVTDDGFPALTTDAHIVISILDLNDNYPVFSSPLYTAALLENQNEFMLVTHIQATDPDLEFNGTAGLVFQLSSTSDNRFALDPRSGDILVTQPILYNQDQMITLLVIATDNFGTGDFVQVTTVEVQVTILPRNLHRPIFSMSAYAATLDEFAAVGTSTGVVVNAVDLDLGGGFGEVRYELHDTTGDFSIDAVSGEIFISKPLDWNRQTKYIVPVIAKDVDERFDLVYVTFNITYNLLHPEPKFLQSTYVTSINENVPFGTLLSIVPHAVDIVNRLEFPFHYYISLADTTWFNVELLSGNISVAGPVDREAIFNGHTVSMTITALYPPNGRTTTCTVIVSVLDLNDNIPQFAQANYSFAQLENFTVGGVVGVVAASDLDFGANKLFQFTIVERTSPCTIDPTLGEIFLANQLDRETAGSHVFTVRATDSGGLFTQVTVTLTVLDVNDNAPLLNAVLAPFGNVAVERSGAGLISTVTLSNFNETNCLSGACSDARTVLALSVTDRDIGVNGQFVFELVGGVHPYASIDATSGRVFLKAAVDRDLIAQFSFTVRVYDLGMPRQSATVNATVVLNDLNDNRPVISSLPSTIWVSEAAGSVPLTFVTATDGDVSNTNNFVEMFARSSTTSNFYFTESYVGMVASPTVPRILSTKKLIYDYSSSQNNVFTINVTARNSLAAPMLVSSVAQVTVNVLPFIGNDTVTDATKILFDWRSPTVCQSLTSVNTDCGLPSVSPWTSTSSVEIWTQRSYGCSSVSCLSMMVNPVTPSVCECLVYGPALPSYNATAQQYLLPGMISGSANAFQLRMFDKGELQLSTPWQNKIVQSFAPKDVTFTMLSLVSYNVTWTAPPTPNGEVLGYRLCYCFLDRVPSSSCTCTGVLGSDASSSPDTGYTGKTFARLPDPAVAAELQYNKTYSVVVELVTLLSDRRQSVARSEVVVFTTQPMFALASSSEFPKGSIAGIVIGVLAALVLIAVFVGIAIRRHFARQQRTGSDGSVNAIIESNIQRQNARLQVQQAHNAVIAESHTDGGFHYYTQERSDQFLNSSSNNNSTGGRNSERELLPHRDSSTTDSVAINMLSAGDSHDEPDSLGTSFVPLMVAPSYKDPNGSPASSSQGQYRQRGSPPPPSPPPQRNFGLRMGHVMDGETKGELIPRSNSRSSPFVSRKRSADAGLVSSDPLNLQFNGHVLTSNAVVINSMMQNKIATLHSTDAIGAEYELVKSESAKFDTPCTVAREPYNVRKNRYSNVLPPDASRVSLSHNGVLGSDYINANYIDGFQTKAAYIATQGPLATTVQDFWRMMWEENSAVIINTTSLEEGGRPKCHKYWPEPGGTIQCGILEIGSQEQPDQLDGYTRRVLVLRNTKTNKERTVVHLSHETWPDHGAPASPDQILGMIKEAHVAKTAAAQHGVNGPMVMHCSAGLGRTGVVCAIDICLQRAAAVGNFDVLSTVLHMRRQRPGMIQTVAQYGFVYDAVARANANAFARAPSEPTLDVDTGARGLSLGASLAVPPSPAAAAVAAPAVVFRPTAEPEPAPTPARAQVAAASVSVPTPAPRPAQARPATPPSDAPLTAEEQRMLEALGGDGPRDMGTLLRELAAI